MRVMRQGDVLIIPVAKMPENLEPIARDKGRVVLAYGEITGHAHTVKDKRAALFRDPKLAAVFMHVSGDATVALEHEEHGTIEIAPGDYEIRRQREYTPEAIRTVAD